MAETRRIKVVFLDIDGTLTEPGKNVPPDSAVQAVNKARKNGHKVFLCSGRNYDMLSPLMKYGFDGAIASSGGYILCGEKVIYDNPMSGEDQEQVLRVLRGNGIFCTVEGCHGAFTDEGFKEFLRSHAGEGGNSELLRWREQIESSLNIRPMAEYQGEPVYKVVLMSPSQEGMDRAVAELGEKYNICIQEANGFGIVNGELLPRTFDKGKGVAHVCEYLGIPMEDSIAFGDSMNDLEMMEAAGWSVCMDNGAQALKDISDEVCPAVIEDGLALAFGKLGLLED